MATQSEIVAESNFVSELYEYDTPFAQQATCIGRTLAPPLLEPVLNSNHVGV